MTQAVQIPDRAIDISAIGGNSFMADFSWIWQLLRVVGIILLFGVLILGFILLSVWIIKLIKGKPTIQQNIESDIMQSATATKRPNVNKVYTYSSSGLSYLGEYLGEHTETVKGKEIIYVAVGHPLLIPKIPRKLQNWFLKINFLYVVPKLSLKEMVVDENTVLVCQTTNWAYNGNTRMYVASDHFGLPKVVNSVFLDSMETEFTHSIVKKLHTTFSDVIEMNPYVQSKMKAKQEFAEGEDDDG